MLGLADRARVVYLFEHLMQGDVAAALNEFRAQYDAGADPAVVLTDLAEFNHLVTRLRFVPEAARDGSLTEDERRRGADFAGRLSVRVLSRTWQMLLKGIAEVQGSNRPVSAGEMVLIRIAHAASLPTLDEALKAIESGGVAPLQGSTPRPNGGGSVDGAPAPAGAGGGVSAVAQARMPTAGGGQTMRLVEPAPQAEPVAPPLPVEAAPSVPVRSLEDIATLADANRDIAFKVKLRNCVRLVAIEPGRIEVSLTEDAPKILLNDMTTRLKAWTGRNWFVSVSREEGGPTLAEVEAGRRESVLMDARADPAVAAILKRFPGARIIDVRFPDAVARDMVDIDDAAPPIDPAADDDDDEL